MPAAQQTVGISSSVAVFLLIISICCVLSLSSRELSDYNGDSNHTLSIVVPSYAPNVALICVMLTGIIAMVIFLFKKGELTVRNHGCGCEFTSRHNLHENLSLYSTTAFFVGVVTINVSYFIVQFCCNSNWLACDNNKYFLDNVIATIFHCVGTVFATFEVGVCWLMKDMNFKPSQWVWHLVAVVQAANISMWFHSLREESYHRINVQEDSLSDYFSFCNTTLKNEIDHLWCTDTTSVAQLFLRLAPILLPITIEFNLLVAEILLDRSIGAESHKFSKNAGEDDDDQANENEMNVLAGNTDEPNEQTRLLGLNEHSNRETNSFGSTMFTLYLSVLINMIYLVLTPIVLLGCKKLDLSPDFNLTYTVYRSFYYLFLTICCVVGMISCRRLKRQKHSHISFLEYLLLFAMSSSLFQSFKKIVAFGVNTHNYPQSDLLPVYSVPELLTMVEAFLQIVFYYYVKDVKLQLSNGENANLSRAKNIILVLSVSNLFLWLLDSFIYPSMTACITPTQRYVIQSWPVFDNVMIPIYIFFRLNSTLLFFCILLHSFRAGHRRGGTTTFQQTQQTAHLHTYVSNVPVNSHRASWPSNRLRRHSHRMRSGAVRRVVSSVNSDDAFV